MPSDRRLLSLDDLSADELRRMVEFLAAERAALETENAALKTRTAALDSENGALKADIAAFKAEIGGLKDEIAVLKGLKPRPNIKPSRMEDGTDEPRKPGGKRTSKGAKRPRNGGKRSLRTSDLKVDEEKVLKPEGVPAGSRFKGCKSFTVQDLEIKPRVTRYLRERYVTPDGQTVIAPLPEGVSGHYGPGLIAFVLDQHYERKVPEGKILSFLHDIGIKISVAQLNALLTENKEPFHTEKQAILPAGLAVSPAITVDDTSARHQGDNWITTHIGSELFAWFETTESKSRCNFLELILHAGVPGWRINDAAVAWWLECGLSAAATAALTAGETKSFDDAAAWERYLDALGITGERTRAVATEGVLWGAISEQHLLDGRVIVSDGAPQFVLSDNQGRCWIHAERQIQRINCATDDQRLAVERTRARIWNLYRSLKAYKLDPDPAAHKRLNAWFDRIFNRTTGFTALDAVLERLFEIKKQLLLVLKRPDIPLHTNGSEGDIRSRVEERKISGCTRGEQGKRCNDTFASISKTLRKHGISFLDSLNDRLRAPFQKIPPISDIIRNAAAQRQSAVPVGPPFPAPA